jgi:arylsulfatase A-like enzyme
MNSPQRTAISRRRFLKQATAAGSAAALAASGCGQNNGTPERPPNVIFLLTDDQRWDTLGVLGNNAIQTPNLDRLASEGVLFENSFVTTSICPVSRASIFTGLYARCHGIHGFQTPLSPELHAMSYPARFRQAGYRTGFIGKYGVGGPGDLPQDRFDYFEGFGGQGSYLNEIDGETVHLTKLMGLHALDFLDGCTPDQPFQLSISFKAPHVQDGVEPYFIHDPAYDHVYEGVEFEPFEKNDPRYFDELPEYLKSSENRVRWEQRFSTPEAWQESMRRYHRLIYGVDVQIGNMLAFLEERGWLDNTVIVFAGDNGFYLGERGLAGKWYMHEESIRTPLVIRDPRRPETAGVRLSETALNIDLCPTMLSLAGLEPPPSMNGRDLTPLLRGESPPWRSEWFYEHLFEHPRIPKSEGVRSGDWKYFSFFEKEPPNEFLYDLGADAGELRNLAQSSADGQQLEFLRGRRRAWVENLQAWRIDHAWREPDAASAM